MFWTLLLLAANETKGIYIILTGFVWTLLLLAVNKMMGIYFINTILNEHDTIYTFNIL